MEELRQDDKAIAVLSQKLTDFMENTFSYRKGQERIQADIVSKLEAIKSTLYSICYLWITRQELNYEQIYSVVESDMGIGGEETG